MGLPLTHCTNLVMSAKVMRATPTCCCLPVAAAPAPKRRKLLGSDAAACPFFRLPVALTNALSTLSLPCAAAAPAPKRRKLGSDAIFGIRVGTDELDRLWNLTEDNLSGEIRVCIVAWLSPQCAARCDASGGVLHACGFAHFPPLPPCLQQ